jgi:hypothetical protein
MVTLRPGSKFCDTRLKDAALKGYQAFFRQASRGGGSA